MRKRLIMKYTRLGCKIHKYKYVDKDFRYYGTVEVKIVSFMC